jgi:Rrf2 family protein
MLKLSRTVEYAVQALLLLARAIPGEPVPCSRLATIGGMPRRFLLQVLRSLVLHEIVNSTRGIDGGYSLARRPEEISLLDVYDAIEGPVFSGGRSSTLMASGMHAMLQSTLFGAVGAMSKKLSELSMAALLAAAGDPPKLAVPNEAATTHAPLSINEVQGLSSFDAQ